MFERCRWSGSIGVLLLLPAVLSGARGQDFKISDNVDYVLLDVSVRDADGSFVTGLSSRNFEVFENGHRRDITYFSAADTPVAVGLIVDNSGSMAPKRPRVVTAGLAFAKQSNPRDEFFVVNFNDIVKPGLPGNVPFTDNLHLLRKALYFGEPQGRTALYDAISYALKHLEQSREQRRTLIVVSDGRDNASRISFGTLLKELEASRATVYTVGLSDPDETDVNRRALRKVAHLTGGAYYDPPDVEQVVEVFNQIASDVRHRYSVEYAPDEVNIKSAMRTVRVVVREDGRKLHTRTRTSYSIARGAE